MRECVERFVLAFIPMFVAIDVPGLVPMFLALTHSLPDEKIRRTAAQALLAAAVASLLFVLMGRFIFRSLSITVADFQIAGGLILLVLAVRDIAGSSSAPPMAESEDFGFVPLGLPFIAGPALLTALLILVESVGLVITLLALAANLLIVWVGFRHAVAIRRVVGIAGLRAFSKIVMLLLAAIAVHLIRVGWQGVE
jgi:multiple antibiotic resistance protein